MNWIWLVAGGIVLALVITVMFRNPRFRDWGSKSGPGAPVRKSRRRNPGEDSDLMHPDGGLKDQGGRSD